MIVLMSKETLIYECHHGCGIMFTFLKSYQLLLLLFLFNPLIFHLKKIYLSLKSRIVLVSKKCQVLKYQ